MDGALDAQRELSRYAVVIATGLQRPLERYACIGGCDAFRLELIVGERH